MATAIQSPAAAATNSRDNPVGIRGIDHIEFLVNDAEQWANYHERHARHVAADARATPPPA